MDIFSKLAELSLNSLNKRNEQALKKLSIETIRDLLYHFPRYINTLVSDDISKLKDGDNVVLRGQITDKKLMFTRSGKRILKAVFFNETGNINLTWYNGFYVAKYLEEDKFYEIEGKVKKNFLSLEISHPQLKKVSEENIEKKIQFDPVYKQTRGLNTDSLQKIISEVLKKYIDLVDEILPEEFIKDKSLMSRKEALLNIHFPESLDKYFLARKRFLYEEIFTLQIFIMYKQYFSNLEKKYVLDDKKDLTAKYIQMLPFELTKSQKQVITNIYNELKEGRPVNRLIQGDVGSGKTVVSIIIMLYMIDNGYQVALLAPTQILASQHYENISKDLEKLGIKTALLTSSVKGKKRKEILKEISSSDIQCIIGTHSLLSEEIEFKKLGMAVIDEQHKFGVLQRQALRDKTHIDNLILMTATPIPRSLAMTIYGDLDISIIKELPSGRQKIITKVVNSPILRDKMYKFINKKLKEGTQVYVISPLIEESKKKTTHSAKLTYEEYKTHFPEYNIGLLHGKLSNDEKSQIMMDFLNQKIDILIATSIVEVGINVKNANVIVIRSANNFGLSSLHQLRGRVGRSKEQGYCFLEVNEKEEASEFEEKGEEAVNRLKILEESTDGFYIANKDLELRKAGQFFGDKQSGLSDFLLLDIQKHIKEIEEIKQYVKDYLNRYKGIISINALIKDIEYRMQKEDK